MLYESLFSNVFEIPSLLTDNSDELENQNQEDSDGLGSNRLDSMVEVFVCKKLMTWEVAQHIHEKYFFKKDIRNKGLPYKHSDYRPFRLKVYHKYLLETGFEDSALRDCVLRDSALRDSALREEDARYIILTLRHLILYLTYHTWGNLKRLNTVFEEFVHPYDSSMHDNRLSIPAVKSSTKFMLSISYIDHQRILLAANIYIPLGHHIGRELVAADDKLKVSTINALNHIFKFHKRGFSRRYLERMVDAINIHSSPHLNSTVTSLLEVVLKPFLRLIRNGFLRYRFASGFEREITYISRVSEMESSSFTFSMESAEQIKLHYKNLLQESKELGMESSAVLRGILGNFYFFEENFDQAAEYFLHTLGMVEKKVLNPTRNSDIGDLNIFLFTILKLGNLYERRHNYYTAMGYYERGCQVVNNWVKIIGVSGNGGGILEIIKAGDSKWNIFVQPFICKGFLGLKHGPGKFDLKIDFPQDIKNALYDKPATWIRRGRLAFFLNQPSRAMGYFSKCYSLRTNYSTNFNPYTGEHQGFWKAVALFSLAECLLITKMKSLLKDLRNLDDSKDNFEKEESCIFLVNYVKFIDIKSEIPSGLNLKQLSDDLNCSSLIEEVFKAIDEHENRSFEKEKTKSNWAQNFPELGFNHALALLIKSAQIFQELDLPEYESRTYFKILSLWSLVQGLLPRRYLEQIVEENKFIKDTSGFIICERLIRLRKNIENCESWISIIRKAASDSVGKLHEGAFGAFLSKYLSEDLYDPNKQPPGVTTVPASDTTSFKVDDIRNPNLTLFNENEERQEVAFWSRSLLTQNCLITGVWEYNYRQAILKTLGSSKSKKLVNINNLYMPPYSAQTRTVSLWLDGNFITNQVRELIAVESTDSLKSDDSFWRKVAKVIRNYYWAAENSQLTSGSHQGLMFVSKYSIYYNLWEFLHDLIAFFIGPDFIGPKIEKPWKSSEILIQKKTRVLLRNEVPINFTDYEYIRNRAIGYLKEIELNGDPNNKARKSMLKTKYYIDDDFEDPQFLMEWTMNQMFSPAALIHRRTIERAKFD